MAHHLDNRGLAAPEPMMRTLTLLDTLAPGELLIALYDRRPVFLLEELEAMGCSYKVEELPEGAVRVSVTKC